MERLGLVMVVQQNNPQGVTDRLLRAEFLRVEPVRNQTANPGSSQTHACILGDSLGRFEAFHKAMEDIDRTQAALYGQDPLSALVNESVARLLAERLGSPYIAMVPAVAIRVLRPASGGISRGYGVLSAKAHGRTGDDDPKNQPAYCDPAAFFDTLIAQQDRHDANYRWQPGRLGLLDNAYAFAAPGYFQWASVFAEARHAAGRGALTANELARLQRLENTPGLWDVLPRLLRSDQAAALRDRVQRMLASRELLQPLEF